MSYSRISVNTSCLALFSKDMRFMRFDVLLMKKVFFFLPALPEIKSSWVKIYSFIDLLNWIQKHVFIVHISVKSILANDC